MSHNKEMLMGMGKVRLFETGRNFSGLVETVVAGMVGRETIGIDESGYGKRMEIHSQRPWSGSSEFPMPPLWTSQRPHLHGG